MGNTTQKSSSRRLSTNSIRTESLVTLYEACRTGNERVVRQLLTFLTPNELNQSVPSTQGNTCLHIAVNNGYDSIVQILLENGSYRSLVLNDDKLSAFDLANSSNKDSTRSLFSRSTSKDSKVEISSRFHDSNVVECFDIVQLDDSLMSRQNLPNVQIFSSEEEKQHEIEYSASSKAMCQSRFGRFCVNYFHQDEPLDRRTVVQNLKDLLKMAEEKENSKEIFKAKDLFAKYENNDESIDRLIHLYTLETEFYRLLKNDCLPLAIPLFIHLNELKSRFFQGRVYRGMRMSNEQIHLYHQAASKTNEILFQTRSFSSTSMNRSIAEQFAFWKNEKSDQNISVLFIFDFPQICDQALNLSRISVDQPALSEYENEQEVLILPWTLFEVTRVRRASNDEDLTTIHFTNRIIPKKRLLSTFKWSWIEMKNQIRNDGKVKFNCAFQKYKTTTLTKAN